VRRSLVYSYRVKALEDWSSSLQCFLDGPSNPHRADRKDIQRLLIPDYGGVLQAFDQLSSDLEAGGSHEGQPKSRQIGRQRRDRDQPPPQPSLPGELPDQVTIGRDIRAADAQSVSPT